jgi:hypothetical protein
MKQILPAAACGLCCQKDVRKDPANRIGMVSLAVLLLAVLLLAGCASAPPAVVSTDNDPANPGAPSGKLAPKGIADDAPRSRSGAAPKPESSGATPQMGGMGDMGGMAMPMPTPASQ